MSLVKSKEILKMIFKNENSTIATFFMSVITLAIMTDLIPEWLLSIWIYVGVSFCLVAILVRMSLSLYRNSVLNLAETKELKAKKQFSSQDKTITEAISEQIEKVTAVVANKLAKDEEVEAEIIEDSNQIVLEDD